MRRLLLAPLIAAGWAGQGEAACSVSAESVTPISAVLYDPFSPVQQTIDLNLRLRNSGDSCVARLYLRPGSGQTDLASGADRLRYRLDGESGGGLAQAAELGPFTVRMPADGTADLLVRAIIAPQQIVPPGAYGDELALRGDTDAGGDIDLSRRVLRLRAEVPARAEMSISGTAAAGLTAADLAPVSIDFPNAATGQTERVFVNVWSNGSVMVSLSSDNGGLLRHVQDVQLPPIPYSARFNGQPLALGTVSAFRETPPMTLAGGSYELAVTLGDTAKKFAGRYRDVISVSVDQN